MGIGSSIGATRLSIPQHLGVGHRPRSVAISAVSASRTSPACRSNRAASRRATVAHRGRIWLRRRRKTCPNCGRGWLDSICLTCDRVRVEESTRLCQQPGEAARQLVKATAGDWDWARRAVTAAGGDIRRALVMLERVRATAAKNRRPKSDEERAG